MTKSSNFLIFFFCLLVMTQSNYITSLAHDLAHLESISYQSQDAIDNWKCAQCSNYEVKSPKSFFSSTANIQGMAFYYPKYDAVVVAFRGSVDTKNWLYNLNTVVTSYPACSGCNVHLGFYSAYKGVAPLAHTAIQQLKSQYRGSKLIITGHSLGGAMAVHCALDVKQAYGQIDYLYTFGQPRVGNQNFANFLQNTIPIYYRIINYADTVPHVPQSALGFKHGGKQIWYNPRGMQAFKECVSEDKACSNSISLTSMSTQDHSLSYYMTLPVINNSRNIKKEYPTLAQLYTDEQIAFAQNIKVKKIIQLIRGQMINNQSQISKILVQE